MRKAPKRHSSVTPVSMMSRLLLGLALLMIVMELCFFLAAHNHIRRNDAGNRLAQNLQEREQGRSSSTYRPDYSAFNVSLPVLYASSPGSLSSIPVTHQVPGHLFESGNFSEHYEGWDHQKDEPPLFVYNPSIVTISSDSQHDHNSNSPSPSAIPQYLALFRVSSIHSCGFPTIEFWKHPTGKSLRSNLLNTPPTYTFKPRKPNRALSLDFLGIGLLDEELTLLEDLVVDINQHLPRIYGSKMKLQDVRIFGLRGRFYLSSGTFLIPICIEAKGLGLDLLVKCKDGDLKTEVPALFGPSINMRLFVSGNAVKLQNVSVLVNTRLSCTLLSTLLY